MVEHYAGSVRVRSSSLLASTNRIVKYVLYYDSSPDVHAKAPLHARARRAHWQRYLDDGTLLMVGPFAHPREGAMAIFTTRDATESFAAGDPFVVNGVVSKWTVREWNEAIVSEKKS